MEMLHFLGQALEISEALWLQGLPHSLRRRRLTKLIREIFRESEEGVRLPRETADLRGTSREVRETSGEVWETSGEPLDCCAVRQ